MPGFLEKLKALFRRKPKAEEVPVEAVPETYAEVQQEQPKEQAKKPAASEEREQKKCAKCRAPNDKFVHMCWLCKAEI